MLSFPCGNVDHACTRCAELTTRHPGKANAETGLRCGVLQHRPRPLDVGDLRSVACPAAVVIQSASRQAEPYIVLCVPFIWETIGRRMTPMCALRARRRHAFRLLGDMCERTEARGLRTRESSAVNLSSSTASPGGCAHTAASPCGCARAFCTECTQQYSSTVICPRASRMERTQTYAERMRAGAKACTAGVCARLSTHHFREELAGRVERDLVEVVGWGRGR